MVFSPRRVKTPCKTDKVALVKEEMMAQPPVRFSVIGINHNHIYGQVNLLLRAGAELVDFFAVEPDLAAEFARAFPQAGQAGSAEAILEDPSIQLIVTAAIPADRAPIGIAA